MKQSRHFYNPVRKQDGSGQIVETGDTVRLILNDNTEIDVTATDVRASGRVIEWDLVSTSGVPRSCDVNGVSGDHVTSCESYQSNHDSNLDDDDELDPPVSTG